MIDKKEKAHMGLINPREERARGENTKGSTRGTHTAKRGAQCREITSRAEA